jgi:hypothetical protein
MGPPEGAAAVPLHNLNPTSPNPNSKNSSDRIYAEIFGPNLGAKLFYRSPLGVMHCTKKEPERIGDGKQMKRYPMQACV